MEHTDFEIDIYNQNGKIIGTKKRKDINKSTDIFHGVKVLICTPPKSIVLSKEVVLSKVPASSRNVYGGLYGGATVATMRRHDETALAAAERTLERELYLSGITLHELGTAVHHLSDGLTRVHTVFLGEHAGAFDRWNPEDIESLTLFTRANLEDRLRKHPQEFSPAFMAVWKEWGTQLPI